MNKVYGACLALVFLFGIGAFNIAKGLQLIRRKRKSTILGVFRIILGLPIIILPFILLYFLKTSGQV